MNVSCDIIRDILPLYAEDMVSDATRELVDDHLCGCDGCVKELAALKKKEPVPVDADAAPIRRISKAIQKQKILTVLCVLLTVASLIWSGVLYMTAPIYLTAEQAIDGVELREDGGLAIDFRWNNGYSTRSQEDAMLIWCATRRCDWLEDNRKAEVRVNMTPEEQDQKIRENSRQDTISLADRDFFNSVEVLYCYRNENGAYTLWSDPEDVGPLTQIFGETLARSEHDYDLWYLEEDGSLVGPLWNGGSGEKPQLSQDFFTDWQTDPYVPLLIVCLVVAALSAGAAYLLRNRKWKMLPAGTCALCAGASYHILVVSGGKVWDKVGGLIPYWNDHFLLTTVLLGATAYLWYYLHCLKKQDKAL